MEYSHAFHRIDATMFNHLMKTMSSPDLLNFGGGSPDPDTFPSRELSLIAERLIRDQGASILQYGPARGIPSFIEAYLQYLYQFRAITATEDQILIVNGGSQGIDLACQVLFNPGDTVLVEAPTYLSVYMMFSKMNIKCVPVEMDQDGIVIPDLVQKIEQFQPKALYIIPTFQNPTGTVLSLDRRKQIVALAFERGMYILEDDPYYDLRYEGEHLPCLKKLDRFGRVILINSFSKIISPGLRIGGVCASKSIIAAMMTIKQGSDMHTPNLNQGICAEYILGGNLQAHLRDVVDRNKMKLSIMLDAMATCFPASACYRKPNGGLFLWVSLPSEISIDTLLPAAIEKHRVAFIPGSAFFYEQNIRNNYMRLNFACPAMEEIPKGIETIGKLLKECES